MNLHKAAVAAGMRLDSRAGVTSTNEEALALARRGERGKVWIAAEYQTAGRGRRGRHWRSEPGNLFASLLLVDPSPPERAAELCFVSGLAVHDAVLTLAPSLAGRLTLKWPNDLLLDGAKLAGILVEGETAANGVLAVVIGIGVNCQNHPSDLDYPAVNLAAAGVSVSPADLLHALSATMIERLNEWNCGSGFPRIRNDWLAHTAGVGEPFRVRSAEKDLIGRFETIDSGGRLVLLLPDGSREMITAADVVPLSISAAPRNAQMAVRDLPLSASPSQVVAPLSFSKSSASGRAEVKK
jgi:BirA family biotin operon repressor/biotin-[acetyl-CoA-carboxylase] ligase